MIMNKAQADALCAIIALGFVGQNETAVDGNGRSLYIYDSRGDANRHTEFAKLLHGKFGIDISTRFENAKDAVTMKKVHPFIYALPCAEENKPRVPTYDEVKYNESNLSDVVQDMEEQVNSLDIPDIKFKGAYIGGAIDFVKGIISLIGPSSLYLRERKHVSPNSPEPATVAKAFTSFKDVTYLIKHFLLLRAHTSDSGGKADGKIVIDPDLTKALIAVGEEDDIHQISNMNKTFSSCHGLVTSIYHHSDHDRSHIEDGICVELSLSNDTCKSASCLPCAIFAASQGTPASAVHFGRGDFWNLPAPDVRKNMNPKLEEDWRSFVIDCFVGASSEVMERGGFTDETMQMAALASNPVDLKDIPEMFIDALTFEGSFIDKMTASFN